MKAVIRPVDSVASHDDEAHQNIMCLSQDISNATLHLNTLLSRATRQGLRVDIEIGREPSFNSTSIPQVCAAVWKRF